MKILEYARLALQNKARRFYLTSGTKPYSQSESRTEPMNEKALVPSEIYSIMDEFLESDLKQRLLNGEDVQTYIPIKEEYSLRVHIFRQRGSLAMSVKLVESKLRELEDCSLPQPCYDSLLKRSSGLVIISGLRDSGRSTTARAMIAHLARKRPVHAVCYEKVLESQFPVYPSSIISRRLLGIDIPNMEECAKMAMREDMDVFFMEDMESPTAFQLALDLSTRGVLVIATMSARNLSNVFERILHCYSDTRAVHETLGRFLLGITHQTRVYSSFHEKSFVIYECFRNYPSTRRHFREAQIYPLVNFLKQSGKPDCITYFRGYEDLVANDVLRWEEVPDEYRV